MTVKAPHHNGDLLRSLRDRVVWITGGGSGIGEVTAQQFAKVGARVVISQRDADQLERVAHAIRAETGNEHVIAVPADVSEVDDVQRAVQAVLDRFGGLDILFSNAGVNGVWAPIDDLEPEEWDHTIKNNLRSTFLCAKYATPHLRARGGGSIIITSSIEGTRRFDNPEAVAYACTKAAQLTFMKMMAIELGRQKIRVNAICPGAISTAIDLERTETRNAEQAHLPIEYPEGPIPLTGKEPGNPRQVAELVLFLASDAAGHITGTEVYIDGGQSLVQ